MVFVTYWQDILRSWRKVIPKRTGVLCLCIERKKDCPCNKSSRNHNRNWDEIAMYVILFFYLLHHFVMLAASSGDILLWTFILISFYKVAYSLRIKFPVRDIKTVHSPPCDNRNVVFICLSWHDNYLSFCQLL